VPPKASNPSLPHDLQTIALKALEKDPGRRYPSAREFADDLRQHLAGEPIQARPAGLGDRLFGGSGDGAAVAVVAGRPARRPRASSSSRRRRRRAGSAR
jgi:hypothetical protein